MKFYYTAAEVMQNSTMSLPDVLHSLAHSDANNGYVCITSKDNERLNERGFLRLPKNVIQSLEIEALKLNTSFVCKIQMSHSLITKDNRRWRQYLLSNEVSEKDIKSDDIKKFESFSSWMPTYYSNLSMLDRYRDYNRVTTTKAVTANDIFIPCESGLIKSVFKTRKENIINGLSAQQIEQVQALIDIAGIEKVIGLRHILDKGWEYYSTELNVALELHDAVFIRNEGNSKTGIIQRVCSLLHEKYPQINPDKNLEDIKEYNYATRRIATVVNADNKK